MKKALLLILIPSLIIVSSSKAYAKDKDWAVAGKILTGVIGLNILADALNQPDYHYAPDNCHKERYHRSHKHRYEHKPRYEYIEEQVWVPAETRKVWMEPEYRYKWRHGRRVKICIRKGYYYYETIPGHYETRIVKRRVY